LVPRSNLNSRSKVAIPIAIEHQRNMVVEMAVGIRPTMTKAMCTRRMMVALHDDSVDSSHRVLRTRGID